MGLCKFADMQDSAMQLGDRRVPGICLSGFHGYAPSRGFVAFTPYASSQGIGFMVSFTPYASTHKGSLRIVEFHVPWITEDHKSVLECWRLVLSAVFVSLEFV